MKTLIAPPGYRGGLVAGYAVIEGPNRLCDAAQPA
jgi:hypothetical protein